MRLRTALIIFVALNAAWATLFLSQLRRPVEKIVLDAPGTNPAQTTRVTSNALTSVTNLAARLTLTGSNTLLRAGTNAPLAGTNAPSPSNTVASVPSIGRNFGWKEVQSEEYRQYLANLRAVGCPEAQIRRIIVQDINDLFDQKRLQEAVSKDPQWWQPTAWYFGNMLGPTPESSLEEERRNLLEKFLGPKWSESVKVSELSSSSVARLTGSVLGAMPTETYNTVQEICNRSYDRSSAYMNSRLADGKPLDAIELAKLRNQTRVDLSKIMTPQELEEFLLRNSHNAQELRRELLGFNPTPEEFRKIFHAVDPIDHQMQVEYGGPESLSPKQREQYQRQRELAIKEALPPNRYSAYLATKDPLYRQAQMVGQQYGLSSPSVSRLVEFYRTAQNQQQLVMQNQALTPQQKSAQVQSLELQKQQYPIQLLQEQSRQPVKQ